MPSITIDNVIECAKSFGLVKGTFLAFFFGVHYWLYHLYNQRIKDAKEQIARIASENREYRERFLTLLDDKFEYETKFNGPPKVPTQRNTKGRKK